MRTFQHYQLNCDAGLAEAARKILEYSGIEKFCLDNETPDQPPLLSPDKIMFANKELVEAGRRCWDVCIMSKEARAELRARDDEESHNFLYNYGDTNADGCYKEMWMLLIWAMLNGHGEEMHGSYVNGQGNFHDVEREYEEIFGVKLDGDVLREMCKHHQMYTHVAEMMEKYEIPFTIDDLQACKSLARSEQAYEHIISTAFNSMLVTIFTYDSDGEDESADDDEYSAFDTLITKQRVLQNMFCDVPNNKRVELMTLGAINLDDVPKDEQYGKFYNPTSEFKPLIRGYEELWDICGNRDGKKQMRPTTPNSRTTKSNSKKQAKNKNEKQSGLPSPSRMEQKRLDAESKFNAIMENTTIEELRDAFLDETGNIGLFEALADGVPMEDVLA